MTRGWAALLLVSLLPALNGCVTAAIPLAAGGLLAKGAGGTEQPRGAVDGAASATASKLRVVRLALTELPPPAPSIPRADSAVTAFRAYALSEAGKEYAAGRRPSALLSRASDLRNDRTNCSGISMGVFIDLDPGRGTFDPLSPGTPDLAMITALDELRASDIEVVWFSRLGANFEEAVRGALVSADLDPAGEDRVVLLSNLEERKQSRRDDMAKQLCPIALIGDERADFDELYLYLKQPDAALALDAMIGQGWFLASPFVGETRETPAALP